MACFAELKFKDINNQLGERVFRLPLAEADANLSVNELAKLIVDYSKIDPEILNYVNLLEAKYATVDTLIERGVLTVDSLTSISSPVPAKAILTYVNDGQNEVLKQLLTNAIDNHRIGDNIHISNNVIINRDGKEVDGVLIKQGDLKKIQIDSKADFNANTFISVFNDDRFQKVLAHELVHYIGDEKIDNLELESPELSALSDILDSFLMNYEKTNLSDDTLRKLNAIEKELSGYDGKQKLKEFFASTISDSDIKDAMKLMKPVKRTEKTKSLFDSFVDFVKTLFSISSDNDDLLKDFINVSSAIIKIQDLKLSDLDVPPMPVKKKIVLTEEQNNVVNSAIKFIDNGNPKDFFLIEGKAGTGKTTVIEEIVSKYAGQKRIAISTVSNKAKQVVASKVGNVKALSYASVCSLLGFSETEDPGVFKEDTSKKYPPLITVADLVIIDECSMINEFVLDQIMSRKKPNTKVVFLGDIGQLPPIRDLDDPFYKGKAYLDGKKSSVFENPNKGKLLTRIRQGEESPILPYADYYWDNSQVEDPVKNPIPSNVKKDVVTEKGSLVFSKTFNSIKEDVVKSFKKAIGDKNPNYIKVVAFRNDTVNMINKYVHDSIFGKESSDYNAGEIIMFTAPYAAKSNNGDDIFIDNSEELIIETAKELSPDSFGVTPIECTVFHDKYNIALNLTTIKVEDRQKYKTAVSKLFEKAKKLKAEKNPLYKDAYSEAWAYKARYANIDYGYAITSHKSQGSTYDIVAIHESDIMSVTKNTNGNKSESMYTGLTRSKNISIIISDAAEDWNGHNIDKMNENISNFKEPVNKFGIKAPEDPDEYQLNSGGAYGADTMWDIASRKFGIKNIFHYREEGNKKLSKKLRESGVEAEVLGDDEISKARQEIKDLLGIEYGDSLEDKLHLRNYYQVSNSDGVFAIANLKTNNKGVYGGTDTAVQLGIKMNKPTYVFDLESSKWYAYNNSSGEFVETDVPVLTKRFAGIGTRDIENYNVQNKKTGKWELRIPEEKFDEQAWGNAMNAISQVLEKTFRSASSQEKQTTQSTPTIQAAADIYSKLGNKTKTENIEIVKQPWALKLPDSIVAMRSDTNIYGNPFSTKSETKQDTLKVESIKDAVERFIEWVIFDLEKTSITMAAPVVQEAINNSELEKKRKALVSELKSGELKGKKIIYYKELNEPSHATALDYLINKYNWNEPIQSQEERVEQIDGSQPDIILEKLPAFSDFFMKGPINVYWGKAESATSTRILSNLAPRKFKHKSVDGIIREYGSVEHAYQSNKNGKFDEVTYNKYVEKGGYGVKIAPKLTELGKKTNLQLMEDLVVESFVQNPNSEAAYKLLQHSRFTHDSNELIDKAFLEGLSSAQTALIKLIAKKVDEGTSQEEDQLHISEDQINKGIEYYNKVTDTSKDVNIPFSKSASFKSGPESVSKISALSDMLQNTYGVKFNLMTSRDIAKQFNSEFADYSTHRAFIYNGEVFINTDKASTAEPLHEMGHIILTALKVQDYDLYEVLLSKINSHPSYSLIANAYKELDGLDLDEEVFVSVFGEHYKNLVRNDEEEAWNSENRPLFDRIISAVKDFFGRLFGVNIDTPNEDFVNMTLDEMMSKFGNMMISGRFANVNTDVLLSNDLKRMKSKLIEEGLLTQMC